MQIRQICLVGLDFGNPQITSSKLHTIFLLCFNKDDIWDLVVHSCWSLNYNIYFSWLFYHNLANQQMNIVWVFKYISRYHKRQKDNLHIQKIFTDQTETTTWRNKSFPLHSWHFCQDKWVWLSQYLYWLCVMGAGNWSWSFLLSNLDMITSHQPLRSFSFPFNQDWWLIPFLMAAFSGNDMHCEKGSMNSFALSPMFTHVNL